MKYLNRLIHRKQYNSLYSSLYKLQKVIILSILSIVKFKKHSKINKTNF
nr:MAG TPA: hypothetical protein [Caudoviricetes sp.]